MSKDTSQDKGYVKKVDKYQDLYSSAFTFLLVGGIGIIVLFLDFFGIIRFNLAPNTKVLFYVVMATLFIGFLIIGFQTSKNAKMVKKQIGEEITATNEIINWFLENYSKEKIDSEIDIIEPSSEEDSVDEVNYFNRADYINEILNEKLENVDETYVEQLTEEIYQKFYDQ
ncbi:MAG: hypothetical protein GX913_02435 [Clostridiales bacterium]|nr:hypothetical protein [Clostridiales bacterium]